MSEKVKSWWSDDGKWFCLLVDDGVSKSTVSLTPQEANQLSAAIGVHAQSTGTIEALVAAHSAELDRLHKMQKEIGHCDRDKGWQGGRISGLALAIEITKSGSVIRAQSAPKPYGEVLDEMDHEAKYQPEAASVTSETLAQFLHENQPIMLGGRSQPLSVYQEFSRLILSEFNIRPKSAFTSPKCGDGS